MTKAFYPHSAARAMSRALDWSRLYAAWLPQRVVVARRGCRDFHHGLLAFSKTTRDPLYQLFVEAWTAQEDPAWAKAVQLTEDQRQERVTLANKIVGELRADMAGAHEDN